MPPLSRDELAEGMERARQRLDERLALVERITAPPPNGVDPELAAELDALAAEMFGTPTPSRNRQGRALRIRGLW